jgi:hypothetical protein
VPDVNAGDDTWVADIAASGTAIWGPLVARAHAHVFVDGAGTYGSSQHGPIDLYNALFTQDEQFKQDVSDLIHSYDAYAGYSDGEIKVFLTELKRVGCNYTAFTDTILEQYYFREDEFERDFGFPLFRSDGKGERTLNRELLLTDVYCSWQSQQDPSAPPDGLPMHDLPSFGTVYLAEKGIEVTITESPLMTKDQERTSVIGTDRSYDDPYYAAEAHTLLNRGALIVSSPPGTQLVSTGSEGNPPPLSGQHAMRVTAIDANGWEVSSWGSRYMIPAPAGSTSTRHERISVALIEFALP